MKTTSMEIEQNGRGLSELPAGKVKGTKTNPCSDHTVAFQAIDCLDQKRKQHTSMETHLGGLEPVAH